MTRGTTAIKEANHIDREVVTRCRDCGFFFAHMSGGTTRDNYLVDPFLLRAPEKRPGPNEPITSRPIQKRFISTENIRLGDTGGVGESLVVLYTETRPLFSECASFGCYKEVWGPLLVEPDPRDTYGLVTSAIDKKRTSPDDCLYFFQYQPGFSAPQHLELEIAEKSAKEQRSFSQSLEESVQRLESQRHQTETGLARWALGLSLAAMVVSLLFPEGLLSRVFPNLLPEQPSIVIMVSATPEPTTTPSPIATVRSENPTATEAPP